MTRRHLLALAAAASRPARAAEPSVLQPDSFRHQGKMTATPLPGNPFLAIRFQRAGQ